jgi:hypothetical protein
MGGGTVWVAIDETPWKRTPNPQLFGVFLNVYPKFQELHSFAEVQRQPRPPVAENYGDVWGARRRWIPEQIELAAQIELDRELDDLGRLSFTE